MAAQVRGLSHLSEASICFSKPVLRHGQRVWAAHLLSRPLWRPLCLGRHVTLQLVCSSGRWLVRTAVED